MQKKNMKRRAWKRCAILVLGGGTLLQVGGCLGAATPVLLSIAESSLLTFLLGQAF
jgi:hypothetical protein